MIPLRKQYRIAMPQMIKSLRRSMIERLTRPMKSVVNLTTTTPNHCVNSQHWVLDIAFREDESRIRDRYLRENFAWLNRFLLSLLKQHPGKNSVVGRRRGCAWNDDFLLEVLTGTTT
jgi:hypothetical protein